MKQSILYVNFSGYFFSFVLPTENNRTHEIDLSSHIKHKNCVITLEYFDGIWKVLSNSHIKVFNSTTFVSSQTLISGKPTYCRIDDQLNFSLLLDSLSEGHLHYKKYDISNHSEIILGKDSSSHIIINNEYISSKHATFVKINNDWFIEDNSRNGLYLNNQRLPSNSRVKLRIFDIIYTGGFKIIFLKDCLAINHSDFISSKLIKFSPKPYNPILNEHLPYLRSPRIQEPLPSDVIEIQAPPPKQTYKKQPLLFVLGPALTTPLPMLTTMMIRMNVGTTGSNTYWIMGVSVVKYMPTLRLY